MKGMLRTTPVDKGRGVNWTNVEVLDAEGRVRVSQCGRDPAEILLSVKKQAKSLGFTVLTKPKDAAA